MKIRYKILLVIATSVVLYLIMHSTYLFNVCEFIVNSSDNGCMVFWNADTSIHITKNVWDVGSGIGSWTGTADSMVEGFTLYDDLKNNSGFIFWHMILPAFAILLICQRDRSEK
ncbi:MAG: hypothetical protein K5798_03655 [Nitrosopumilus sp.]|uniref:hypothetical protein n=1 Tax=Nitrosopumilus sp. TaxID=2024843 RepID=UPI002431B829|nr:hypothetical protein [Nitrosopumilus sp.]MCV0366348.1 hypothetical protein [Nitrosopumilus sp.]